MTSLREQEELAELQALELQTRELASMFGGLHRDFGRVNCQMAGAPPAYGMMCWRLPLKDGFGLRVCVVVVPMLMFMLDMTQRRCDGVLVCSIQRGAQQLARSCPSGSASSEDYTTCRCQRRRRNNQRRDFMSTPPVPLEMECSARCGPPPPRGGCRPHGPARGALSWHSRKDKRRESTLAIIVTPQYHSCSSRACKKVPQRGLRIMTTCTLCCTWPGRKASLESDVPE